MAITNPFTITYADFAVGGDSSYQLVGPYVIDKTYGGIRLVFDVMVVGTSFETLQSLSDALEDAFRVRLTAGDTLVVDLNGSSWTYTHGATILHTQAQIAKTGHPDTDRGYSRAYTVTIQGELPADATADAGLRDVETLVHILPGRQHQVTMRGVYTATSSGDAVSRYQADFDARASAILSDVKSGATFELIDESYTLDREVSGSTPAPHLCSFTRQYVEMLAAQSQSATDDAQIRDHRITFSELIDSPGDAAQNIRRLRRIVGTYDCAIDIDETTDIRDVFTQKVRPHVLALIRSGFDPLVMAVEQQRFSYDETAKRMSVAMQIVYQPQGAEAVVESVQSLTYRESRSIDYTPVHKGGELEAYVDPGWAVRERVQEAMTTVIGGISPHRRLDTHPVTRSGWNLVASTSQASPTWIGDPDDEQIEATVLKETTIERFSNEPR